MKGCTETIFDSLVTQNGSKHLWIKKAAGLGVSEFMLRFMAWLCLKDSAFSGSQMCIVTGPRIDLAIALIDRMKGLFRGKGLLAFNTKETVIELNPDGHLISIAEMKSKAADDLLGLLGAE